MSDTPRTDALMEFIHDRGMTEWVPADLARELERERNQLLVTLEILLEEYESQRCQFGEEYLWKKYELPEVVGETRKVIEGVKK